MREVAPDVRHLLEPECCKEELEQYLDKLLPWGVVKGAGDPLFLKQISLGSIKSPRVYCFFISVLMRLPGDDFIGTHTYTPDVAYTPYALSDGGKPTVIEVYSLGADATLFDLLKRLSKYPAAFNCDEYDFEL